MATQLYSFNNPQSLINTRDKLFGYCKHKGFQIGVDNGSGVWPYGVNKGAASWVFDIVNHKATKLMNTQPREYMRSKRSHYLRVITYDPVTKAYYWHIYDTRTRDVVATNKETTLADAKRVVRSTTKFLFDRWG